jgi:hypothetical protein
MVANGIRAISLSFAYEMTATASLPLKEMKQYLPSPLLVTQ